MLAAVPRLDDLAFALEELERQGLLRVPDTACLGSQQGVLLACSNDYLGLAAGHVSRETPARAGAGASRLIHGTHPEHLELEEALAAWVGHPAALLFSSGYAANVGALSALCDHNDIILSDRLNHASLVDGCRLSRATVVVIDHGDDEAVAHHLARSRGYRARWLAVESYYSMDGDSPKLPRLRALCDEHDANLYVDEAHAVGVFGPAGSGLCRALNVVPDVLVGTLGKSVGVAGAFVAGSDLLRRWLWNRARSFVFSTGTPPILAELLLRNLHALQQADDTRARLENNASVFRSALTARGIPLLPGNHGPIVPILVGDAQRSVRVAGRLLAERIVVQAIRPPTVPAETARLRVTVTAAMTAADIERLASSLASALAAET
ncbi:MAG TPA: 8-amino-7-oxononanoate synthase [Polyangiaceae bacterium]|nr:8-amino-7-oxononanoate synthase [Polyangiaceae bacterium]